MNLNPFRLFRAADRRLYRPSGYAPLPRLDLREHRKQQARDTALRNNPLGFGPVWQLCLRMGALPIKTYALDPETGQRKEDRQHPGYNLLRSPSGTGPEARLTRNLLIGGTVLNMLTYNRAFWLKVRDSRGKPVELWPMPPTLMSPVRSGTQLISHYELRPIGLNAAGDNEPERIPFADVLYFRLLPAPDDWADALAPLEPLAVLLGMGKDAVDAASEYFQTGDLHGGVLETKGRLTPEAVQRLEARFDTQRRKRFKFPVLEEGVKLNNRDVSGTADVLITAIDAATKVAKDVFGIPADGDRTRFYAEAIQPIADAIEQELERGLFSEWPEQPAFPEFGFREILKGDPKERVETHARAIMTMQETPDEARMAENRPALGGPAEMLWGPLNLTPLTVLGMEDMPPRKADSAGGLGGEEGRGTRPSAQSGPQADEPREPTRAVQDARRLRAKQLRDRWGQGRERLVRGRSDQLARQLRGLLGRELRALRQALRTKRAVSSPLPPAGDLEDVVRRHDPDMADRLRGLLADTSEASWAAAAELIEASEREVSATIERMIEARAEIAAERFGEVRVDALRRALDEGIREGWTQRELGEAIGEIYEGLEIRYVDGIARTEVAFAHEQAALGAWADAGVSEVEMVFGGGPCTTGVCEEAAGTHRIGEAVGDVGYSFEGADAAPLHPSCTCFAVPAIDAEIQEAIDAAG